MSSRALLLIAALVIVVGGVYVVRLRGELTDLRRETVGGQAQPDAAARSADAPPAPAAAPGRPRSLSAEQRRAIVEVLQGETDSTRTVWFQVDERNSEAVAFQKELSAAFREAGWRVDERGSGGLTFKPGIFLLVGEEEWPHYATTAHDALGRAGLEVKGASGYRAYYEEQKRDKPGWQGPRLDPDQTYVILIGASPATG
jgi:hypothetical protein